MADDVVIKVDGVSKDFLLPHERTQSIKTAFVNGIKGKRNRTMQKQHALKDISFEVKRGEFFGIVGRNGSGKSTLLKILAQIYQPTKGSVQVKGRLVPFIELGVGFNPELTGRDNVYLSASLLGFDETEIEAMYDDIVKFSEIEKFMDQKLKNYSSGMQVRLAFSVAVQVDTEVLLIDEVLAVGDADFQRKCFQYFKTLKRNGKTVIFVSHDMNAIREFCDRAMLIEKSRQVKIGSSADVATEYSKLFLKKDETTDNSKSLQAFSIDSKRWGDGRASMSDCRAVVDSDGLTISTKVVVNSPIDVLICGLHVFSEDGVELTAMNNRMIGQRDLVDLSPGNKKLISWKMLNVFNDGNYYVNLTLVDSEGTAVDWMVGAATFSIKRQDRSTTAILPPVKLSYK